MNCFSMHCTETSLINHLIRLIYIGYRELSPNHWLEYTKKFVHETASIHMCTGLSCLYINGRHICFQGPILHTWINFNLNIESNYFHYKKWYEVTYQIPNFNGAAVEFCFPNLFSPDSFLGTRLFSHAGNELIHVGPGNKYKTLTILKVSL